MAPNHVNLGRTVTFTKNLASVVALIFLPETLISPHHPLTFSPSNPLKFAELVENELTKRISKNVTNLSLLILKILGGEL